MQKEELEQLKDLRAEIRELQKKIVYLQQKKIGDASDKVQASRADFPYTQGSAMISGFNEQAYQRQQEQINNNMLLLVQRQRAAEKLERRITEYINTVTDSRLRRIMQYRYVEGYTWENIGKVMHCDRTTAEKMVTRYLRQ